MEDEDQIARFEKMGEDEVRLLLDNKRLHSENARQAIKWLATKNQESTFRRETSQAEANSIARDAKAAAERAAAATERASLAAERQARAAESANKRATIALIIAVMSIIVSAVNIWIPHQNSGRPASSSQPR